MIPSPSSTSAHTSQAGSRSIRVQRLSRETSGETFRTTSAMGLPPTATSFAPTSSGLAGARIT